MTRMPSKPTASSMRMMAAPMAISAPAPVRSPDRELADIRDVFGLESTSSVLAEITGTPTKTLHRVANGTRIRPRTHIEIVADFAREVRDMMFADPTWTDERRRSMRRWLDVGEIEFDGNVYTPRQVLADEKLARRALVQLRTQLG